MNNIVRNIILLSAGTLVGCATPVLPEKTAGVNEPLAIPKPSYHEKTGSVPMEQVKAANCPNDGKWESYEWQNVAPLANACAKAKAWGKVEQMGNFIATHAVLTPWGPYYLALAAEGRKDYPRAIWMLELALKKAPKEGIFHYELGRIHWQLGEDSDAIKHLQQASELSPGLTEAHFVMGQLALQRHDYSVAAQMFQNALHVNSKHLPSLLGMSELSIAMKDYAKAESYLNQALSQNPRSTKIHLALAQVQEEHLKKFKQALDNYNQIKRLNAEKKLDLPVQVNLDDHIRSIEKSITAAEKANQLTVRTPTGERKVE
jgi:tetratricopeptide (TPR) repeat protein